MTTGMRRSSVRAVAPWLLAALLLLVALLSVAWVVWPEDAGTGIATTGDSEAAAPADTTAAPLDQQDAGMLYAQCMRDNGVRDFPDPNADGSFALGHDEFDRDDPTFRAAQEACSALAPGGEHRNTGDPAYVEQMREFSQCMRDNGLPDFPDPDADGRLRGLGHEAQDDPTYRAAMETCREKLPGGGDHR